MSQHESIAVEIDGPGLHKDTIDPRVALPLLVAYFRALDFVAKERLGLKLELHGLDIEEKCMLARSHGDRDVLVPTAHALGDALVDPDEHARPIRALGGEIQRMHDEGMTVSVHVGGLAPVLLTVSPENRSATVEVTEIHAVVMRSGGAQPVVDLLDVVTDSTLQLSATRELASKLAKHLYEEAVIFAEVTTDHATGKRTGIIDSFRPVPRADPQEAWREWFQRNAAEWNDVDDVDAELDR